jgi:hypothetical protein
MSLAALLASLLSGALLSSGAAIAARLLTRVRLALIRLPGVALLRIGLAHVVVILNHVLAA